MDPWPTMLALVWRVGGGSPVGTELRTMSRNKKTWPLMLLCVVGIPAAGAVLAGHQSTASADASSDAEPAPHPGAAPMSHADRKKSAEEALLRRTREARTRLEALHKKMANEGRTELADRMSQRLVDMETLEREHDQKLVELEE